jgi:hypothetical protein
MSADWKWANNNKAHNGQYVNANVAGSTAVTTIEEATHDKNKWKRGNRHWVDLNVIFMHLSRHL